MFRPRASTAIILTLLVTGGSTLSVCSAAAARSASRHVPTQGHQPSGRCSSKSGSTIEASTSLSKVPERTARARKSFSESEQELAGIPGMGDVRFWGDSVEAYLQAIRPVGAKQNGDWLILSAGGEDGAFGAGLLAGWSKAGTRPDFSVVTGVSTGALMATYAFLGAAYDERLHDLYTRVTAADVFEVGATRQSMLDTWPLEDTIAKNVTPELMADVAREHQRGRRLFVVTTNLDAGRPVVWDMGAIANHGGDAALKLFRQVLLASASVPGIFPPVMIEAKANGQPVQEMHVDGGTTAPFYVVPIALLLGTANIRLPADRLHVLMNGKLVPAFQVTEQSTIAILGRSMDVLINAAASAEVAAVKALGQRDGIAIDVASIDPAFSRISHGAFDSDYMKALFDHGFEQGTSLTVLNGQSEAKRAASAPISINISNQRSNP